MAVQTDGRQIVGQAGAIPAEMVTDQVHIDQANQFWKDIRLLGEIHRFL
jgi:hypothetical protein